MADQLPPLRAAEAGTTDRGSDFSGSSVEVNASQSGSSVSIKIGTVESKAQGTLTSWSVTASAPASGSERTDLATLDGLADTFTVGVKYQQFRAPGVLTTSDVRYDQTRKEICDEELPEAYSAATGSPWNPNSGAHNCDTATVQEYLPHRYLGFRSLFWDSSKWKFLWGVEGRAGFETFRFGMPHEPADEVSRTPVSAKAFISFNPPRSSLLMTAGAEVQRIHLRGPEVTTCPAAGADAATGPCYTGVRTPPTSHDRQLLFVELRYAFSSKLAASLQVTHSLAEGTTGLDLPFFFFGDDRGLRGGIRLGWRDDEEQPTTGIFVGKAFTLFE